MRKNENLLAANKSNECWLQCTLRAFTNVINDVLPRQLAKSGSRYDQLKATASCKVRRVLPCVELGGPAPLAESACVSVLDALPPPACSLPLDQAD